MSSLAAALRHSLTAPLPPRTPAGLVDYIGGRPAAARVLVGLPPDGPLPRRGTSERRRYDAASRRVQRWTTTAGERRKPPADDLRRLRNRARGRASADLLRRLEAVGARARLFAVVDVPSPKPGAKPDRRERELPAGGPGQYLTPDAVRGFVAPFRARQYELAAMVFLAAFADAYGFLELMDSLGDVVWLRVWPDGEPEPGGGRSQRAGRLPAGGGGGAPGRGGKAAGRSTKSGSSRGARSTPGAPVDGDL